MRIKFSLLAILCLCQAAARSQDSLIFNVQLKNADTSRLTSLFIGSVGDYVMEIPRAIADLNLTLPSQRFSVPLKEPTEAYISLNHVYLEPGNEYDLIYDAKDKSLQVGGKSYGNYLCWKLISQDSVPLGNFADYSGREMELKEKIKLNCAAKLRTLDSLRKGKIISEGCYQYVYDETYYRNLSRYRSIISSLKIDPYGQLAEELLSEYQRPLYSDKSKMHSKFYRGSLYEYADYILSGNRNWEYNEMQFKKTMKTITNTFTGFQKEYLFAYLFYIYSRKDSPEINNFIEPLLPKIKKRLHTPWLSVFVDSVANYYSKLNKELPDRIKEIWLYDSKNDSISFATLVNKAGDKSLYVDFWASWCGPCIQQINSYNKRKHSINPENTEVLFISVDEDPERFRRAAKGLNLNSFLLKPSDVELFSKNYSLDAIPRTILIRQGKIKELNADLNSAFTKTNKSK